MILKPMEEHNGESLMEWYYSGKYPNFFRHTSVYMKEADFNKWDTATGNLSYMIYLDDKKPSGMACIYSYMVKARTCKVSILLDEKVQGQKLTPKIFMVLLDRIFHEMNMYKVMCEVLEEDSRLSEWMKKSGFKLEGMFKDHALLNGKRKTELVWSIFKKDFIELGG